MKRKGFCIVIVFCLLAIFPQMVLADAAPYNYYGKRVYGTDSSAYQSLVNKIKNGKGIKAPFVSGLRMDKPYSADIIHADNPRIYFMGGYSYSWSGNADSFHYTILERWKGAYSQKATFRKYVSKAVKAVKAKAGGLSKAKQCKAAFDYIVENCSYGPSQYDQTAYGVFVKKKAVCAGYARAYKLLLDELRIPCICVPCQLSARGSHMCNFVKIGSKWYCVDVTCGDGGQSPVYDLFLIGRKNPDIKISLTKAYGVKLPALSAKDYKISREDGGRYLIGPLKLTNAG